MPALFLLGSRRSLYCERSYPSSQEKGPSQNENNPEDLENVAMTGRVSDYLRSLIKRQVDDKGIVVWYDPEGHYQEFAKYLDLPGTPLEKYEGSFFSLRHRIDPFLYRFDPSGLIVYVPLDRSQTHNALVEVEAAGVVIFPGAQPRQRNTRLSVVAKAVLRGKIDDQELTQIEKQIDAGKLALADLDRMADGGPGSSRGLLSLIFGTNSPHDVALRFLSRDQYDEEIVKKDALPELSALLQSELELAGQAGENPKDLRGRLARHVLTTDFLNALQGSIPQQLSSLKTASEPAARKACMGLARSWRLRRDLRDSYVAASNQVFADLGLSKISLNMDQIINVETFLETEQALQSMVEDALAKETRADLVETAEKHQSGFWSEQPVVQARWSSITVAGQVLREADRVERSCAPARRAPNLLLMLMSLDSAPGYSWIPPTATWRRGITISTRRSETTWNTSSLEPGRDTWMPPQSCWNASCAHSSKKASKFQESSAKRKYLKSMSNQLYRRARPPISGPMP
jgi:hypothetical protein